VSAQDAAELTIGDVAARAGVAEGTLRMWEARHGFPNPVRLPSGHRRYRDLDVARVQTVVRAREQGLSLAMAIERAQRLESQSRPSVFGALREAFVHLHPQLLPKPALVWISRAIEDECCARSPHPLLFACFQRERHYREVAPRWRELARTAERAIVLADFERVRKPRGAPVEIPIRPSDPVMREWVVVCDAPELSAVLVGWERPNEPEQRRTFETIWSVEPEVAREASPFTRHPIRTNLHPSDTIPSGWIHRADCGRERVADPPAADATPSPGTCPKHGPGKTPSRPPTVHPQPWLPDPDYPPERARPQRSRGQAG
jgi:MerR family transcriptional regulator, light-induced transcriptional regulator